MWKLLQTTIEEFFDDDCPMIAAALAYYTMFSLAPLLVIVLTLCGLVFDAEDVRGRIGQEISSVVGENGAQQVQEMVAHVHILDDAVIVRWHDDGRITQVAYRAAVHAEQPDYL